MLPNCNCWICWVALATHEMVTPQGLLGSPAIPPWLWLGLFLLDMDIPLEGDVVGPMENIDLFFPTHPAELGLLEHMASLLPGVNLFPAHRSSGPWLGITLSKLVLLQHWPQQGQLIHVGCEYSRRVR